MSVLTQDKAAVPSLVASVKDAGCYSRRLATRRISPRSGWVRQMADRSTRS
jgi:hypothetical protein